MEELNWYRFSEYNDNEGETWNFFYQLTDSEVDVVSCLLDTEPALENYALENKIYSESVIDTLVENSPQGYMPQWMKQGRPTGDIKALANVPGDEIDYMWYKNGLVGVV